jgi:hypothetical protein
MRTDENAPTGRPKTKGTKKYNQKITRMSGNDLKKLT